MSLPPFQTLLDDHGRDVHRFLIATAGRQAADDCYQETWLSALRAYPRLREGSNLRGWLLTIAHRKAIDHFRSARRLAVPVAVLPEPSTEDVDRPGRLVAATADRLAPTDELDGELFARVRELPPKQRSAVGLRFVLDASYAEIAAAMNTTEEAARRNVHEALKRLRKELDGHG